MSNPILSDLLHEALAAIKEWARLHTTLLSNVRRLVDAARAVLGKIGATPEGQALRIALAGLDVESSLPLCARCGLVRVQGRREDTPVCPLCDAAVLRDLLEDRERDLAALREAAGALVAFVEKNPKLTCEQAWEDKPCDRHATRLIRISRHTDGVVFCEKHAADLRPENPGDHVFAVDEDLPHAASLRTLRALIGGAS